MKKVIFYLALSALLVTLLSCDQEDDIDLDNSTSDNALSENCVNNFNSPNLPSTWQPWQWSGYEKFPSLYFAAEPEGYLNASKMARLNWLIFCI
ncbi:MAG: hypothetical protein AAFX57_15390 [Bacteroidota bacterium]